MLLTPRMVFTLGSSFFIRSTALRVSIPAVRYWSRGTPRVDGPAKVSGTAKYTSDFHFPGMLYAVPVGATIANGRVVKLDIAAAQAMPGVRAIFHRENIGKMFRSVPQPGFAGVCKERRPPFDLMDLRLETLLLDPLAGERNRLMHEAVTLPFGIEKRALIGDADVTLEGREGGIAPDIINGSGKLPGVHAGRGAYPSRLPL